jgi:transcriptional regulator with XRE-family HTH domain
MVWHVFFIKLPIMDVKITFGGNLKFYRKEKRLSQEQLSEMVDISVKHLSAIERGLTFVSADLLDRLAQSLDIPVFYLFINGKEIFHNEAMFSTIDSVVTMNLIKAIEDIKREIRQDLGTWTAVNRA